MPPKGIGKVHDTLGLYLLVEAPDLIFVNLSHLIVDLFQVRNTLLEGQQLLELALN